MTRSLEVFQVESDRRLAEMEQAQVLASDRERIGRELHDGIVQKIYAAGLGLEEAQHLLVEQPDQSRRRIQGVMQALNETIKDVRSYVFDLPQQSGARIWRQSWRAWSETSGSTHCWRWTWRSSDSAAARSPPTRLATSRK